MIKRQQRAPKKAGILFSENEITSAFVAYNKIIAERGKCVCVTSKLSNEHKNKLMNCECLSALLVDDTAVQTTIYKSIAAYQLSFGALSNTEQQFRVLEWMKYAEDEKIDTKHSASKSYLIPYSTVRQGRRSVTQVMKNKICINALLLILGKRFFFYNNIRRHYNNNTTPKSLHNNNENARGKVLERGEYEELMQYLCQVETLAEPSATRLVREVTGSCTIRDNNDKIMYLPSNMSKRGVYRQYCEQRGKNVVTSHDGSISLEDIDDINSKECISWCMFHNFWRDHFTDLKVSKCSEDICKECYVFFNRNKFFVSSDNRDDSDFESEEDEAETEDEGETNTNSDTTSDSEDEAENRIQAEAAEEEDTNSDTTTDSEDEAENRIQAEVTDRGYQNEREILLATKHVENARGMREFLNKYVKKARNDVSNGVPWNERTNVLVGDYAQYMHLPFFGKKQPGDSYYFVPMNVNNFGMANPAAYNSRGEVCDHLYAHIYKEGTAKRGGNEVASLVMKTLEYLGWLNKEENGPGKELVLCFDNCPGQNKNKMVIRLAMYLVECNYFTSVTICFLVRGHTKNTCDRLFNLLKAKYRKENVFTFDQMIRLMTNEYCTVLECRNEDFKDYDSFLSDFYCRLKKVLKHHIFKCNKTDEGKIIFESNEGNIENPKTTNYKKVYKQGFYGRNDFPMTPAGLKEALTNRIDIIDTYLKEVLIPPGIPAIKQVGMFQNFRPLVELEYRDNELYKSPPKKVWDDYLGDKEIRKQQKIEMKYHAKTNINKKPKATKKKKRK